MRMPKYKAYCKSEGAIINKIDSIDFTEYYVKFRNISCCFNNLELLQYTGLEDEDEQEIYEGHVVHITNEEEGIDYLAIIKYQNGAFCATDIDNVITRYNLYMSECKIKVVGWKFDFWENRCLHCLEELTTTTQVFEEKILLCFKCYDKYIANNKCLNIDENILFLETIKKNLQKKLEGGI